jgi:hypothetical protein
MKLDELFEDAGLKHEYTITWKVEGTRYTETTMAVSEKQAINQIKDRLARRIFQTSREVAISKFNQCIKGQPTVVVR